MTVDTYYSSFNNYNNIFYLTLYLKKAHNESIHSCGWQLQCKILIKKSAAYPIKFIFSLWSVPWLLYTGKIT